MKHVYIETVRDEADFAERAAKHFAANPKHYSYSDGDISPGTMLALRWGLGKDCVLVLLISGEQEPAIYGNVIRRYMEPSA